MLPRFFRMISGRFAGRLRIPCLARRRCIERRILGGGAMSDTIPVRRATPADAEACGRVIYDAFVCIADAHRFPHDFPSVEATTRLARMMTGHPAVFGVVAESGGKLVGCNFLDERDAIRGVGPMTVDPAFHGRGIGRRLMQAVLDRGRGAVGIRLVQDAFNTVSMSLYASLGFDAREPLALMRGTPAGQAPGRGEARMVREEDVPECADLCGRVHGFDRGNELRDAVKHFGPMLLTRGNRVVAYASAPTFWPLNHGVGETEEDLFDLLIAAGAASNEPLSLIVPIRRSSFFRRCLAAGLRVVKPMTLMSVGEYHEPNGAFYPSVAY
jgi:predicted N-acetyltransferase YhbS